VTIARLRSATREVWQYGSSTMPAWVHCSVEPHPDGLYLVRRSGKQRIEFFEWLIRDLDGDPMWMTNEDFQREYELT